MKFENGLEFGGKDGAELEGALAKAGGRFGILFAGKVGSGKTTAAQAVAADGNGFRAVDCAKADEVAWLDGWREWLGPKDDVILDDMGRDADESRWGVRRKPVADFIRDLHAAWKRGDWSGRLFITTNASYEELVRRYDESVMNRVRELCVVCRFGELRRAKAGAEGAAETPEWSTLRKDDPYRWDEYERHGIDTESDGFRAAAWGASLPGFMDDALRILRVDMGALSGEECERVRSVCYWTKGDGMRRYLRDVFIYAICADAGERDGFVRGLKAYANAVFEGSEPAKSHYNPQNAATFRDWWRRFDLGALVGEWRERHKNRKAEWTAARRAVS